MAPLAHAETFAAKVDYPTGANPFGLTSSDFNGDGKPDLATTNQIDNTASVLLNNGNGTFAAKIDTATGTSPFGVTSGDFNGDGKPDLAAVNNTDSTVSVLLNNGAGTGTFAAKTDYTVGSGARPVTNGDFNGDGKLDIAVGNLNAGTVSVYLNTGNGTFAAQTTYPTDSQPFGMASGDFNGDGKADLVTANLVSTVSVLLSKGDGTFAAQTSYTTGTRPYGVTSGDFNGDGKPDLAVANGTSNTVSVLLNRGDGTFATKVDYPTGANPFDVTSGDFNGDGQADLALPNGNDNTMSVLLNKGDGTFAAKTDYPTGTRPYKIRGGDFNGDGKADLAVINLTSGTVSVFLNTTTPFYPTVTTGAASGLTTTGATLGGTVNPFGSATTAQFQYGTTTAYGSTASVTLSPNNGSTAQSVSATLAGLTPGTIYHYRLAATNSAGTSNGSDATFTTVAAPAPTVTTGVASPVGVSSATLSGTVNPAGGTTTAQFQYGTSTSYGSSSPVTLAPADGSSVQNVSANLTGLAANTLYHYRLSATNNSGTSNGADATFTTGSFAPTVDSVTPTAPFDGVGSTRAFSVTVSDANGVSDISSAWFMANTQLDWSSGATLVYLRASNQLYLRNGDSFAGPITPGSGTLSNNAVSIDGSSVAVSTASNSLTLNFALQAKNGMVGSNKVWGRVEDAAGLVDPASPSSDFGFVRKGTWSVDGTSGIQQPPSIAVSPGAKSTSTNLTVGSEFTLGVDLTDPNGLGDLRAAYVLVNNPGNLDWAYGFTLLYDVRSNRLYLRSTDGTAFLGGQVVGQSTGTLANESGSVRLDGCTVTPITNGVHLSLAITPLGALAGTRQVWSHIEDRVGNMAVDADANFGFKTEGTWVVGRTQTVPSPSAQVLVAGQSTAKGTSNTVVSGQETTFTLNLNDAEGAGQINSGWILINSPGNLDWGGGITLVLDARRNMLNLRSTDGQSFAAGQVGSLASLENAAVSVRLSGCKITRTAQGLSLTITATPKVGYVGTKQMWSRVDDVNGNVQADHDEKLGFNTEGQLIITAPANTTARGGSGGSS